MIGVFGLAALVITLGFTEVPARASWPQLLGESIICGIGYHHDLFIGLLAFASHVQNDVKVGILLGSLTAGLAG